jgi:ribosomal protein S17
MDGAPRGRRKTVVGMVVSDRMQKTVVVAVERVYRHPDYNKLLRRRTKVKAHDEENACKVGDPASQPGQAVARGGDRPEGRLG